MSELVSEAWSIACNDLIYRVCKLFPRSFVGVCQLPQTPGAPLANCVEELERSVNELGFIQLPSELEGVPGLVHPPSLVVFHLW